MSVKKWLLLPFEGAAGSRRDPYHAEGHPGPQGDTNDTDFTKHETAQDFANKKEEDIVQDFNAPIRWYLCATLFPLTAGTFGPLASAFNICAVVIDWRIIVDPSNSESEGQYIRDPRWLVAVNAVSLAIAIIANLALLAHMTERLRFNVAAPMTILGWYVSGFLDIALVSAAPKYVPLPTNAMATYSQAYFYAIFAGSIYVILSMMLTTTAFGVWIKHFSSEFKLSISQRSLMLQTIMFLGYVLAAAAVYSKVEGWVYVDSFYYIIVTLFTIGFGDLTPKTRLGRGLYFPMAVGGILFVGLIIANIRTLVLESASVKVSTRLVEKARYKAIKSGNPREGILKVRGLIRIDTNAATELERREKEFYAMRAVQASAAHNNRILALFLSMTAFMILWFIGAVVFWQAEKGVGGQNWTYFESVYFTYTAQLTIGYGDFEPQTNSSKPAFVFWALLALPTLTVLIGAVGDAVSDFVNWSTVWVGKHASDFKNVLKGIHKRPSKTGPVKETLKKTETKNSVNSEEFKRIAQIENGKVVPTGLPSNVFRELSLATAEHAYRPFIMLQAAQEVLSHLDAEPPRKYNYEEWTWLLRLLGEDESTGDSHRVVGHPLPGEADVATPVLLNDKQVWSWMGQESPLMTLENDSEPKFVLKRLMEILESELKQRGDQHISQEIGRLTGGRQ